ncbi:metallo-beta-lactamase family protein [Catenibacillus scindens]|uniref:Metallo-beta-lactamase family protein n=1 Tax=Catenibacillus scindens TaxID=673271 RepID=A0A7W8M5B7_9FIRM|nr:MBL fold metallo-hydrolase [Catenibacillus scindens]MBB5265073.1 metallo-beta-lactamase family protein [Catenibacillus scindens]
MKLTFLGATHEVTGSCTLLEACGRRILIDYGLEQGPDTYENCDIPVVASEIDAVLLTHAHIDHSGRLPLLGAQGFKGNIYATGATCRLCDIMLQDSAHIQESEAKWRNRKAKRAGKPAYVPLYTVNDAIKIRDQFVPCNYEDISAIFPGIQVRFVDAGHLLGSSSIEITVTENKVTKTIVFSGDIGNTDQPLIRNPQYLTQGDIVIMESTYGDRSHDKRIDYISQLTPIIQRTLDRGGNVVIPSFAVGRTQELLYFIRQIKDQGLIHGHDHFPVYVDSPLAVEATQIFSQSMYDYFDSDALALIDQGINPINFSDLKVAITSDDSITINEDPEPKVIISASGMCEAGRIRHHLKHNLWRPESTILFVGYQANGTLGRAIVEGAREVRLFDEHIHIEAEICQLSGISGHADNEGLMAWIKSFHPNPSMVFVNHGEDQVCQTFANRLINELGLNATAPYNGACYDLITGECLYEGNKKKITVPESSESAGKKRYTNPVYQQLVDAGVRLTKVIDHNEGGANKDLRAFIRELNDLCEKWDR